MAVQKLFPAVLQSHQSALELAQNLNLIQERNENALAALVDQVLNNMPDKVNEYKKGKKGLIGLFSGEVKKLIKGKADMQMVNSILDKKLNN